MYPDYIPVYRTSTLLSRSKKGFADQTNIIKRAKGVKADGSSEINDPIENMVILVDKMVKAARNNDVGLEIVKGVREGNFGELFKIQHTKASLTKDINKTLKEDGAEGLLDELTQQFTDVFERVAKGKNTITVMEDGKQIILEVLDPSYLKLLKSLGEGNMKSAAEKFPAAFRKFISNPIKELITQKNPLFGVFNGVRDFQTAFVQGQYKGIHTFTYAYFKAFKEVTSMSKEFKEFLAQGGMQSGFFKNNITKVAKDLRNPKLNPLQKGYQRC